MTGVVLAGGVKSKGETYLYSLTDDTWTQLGDLKTPRFGSGKLLPMKVAVMGSSIKVCRIN